MQRLIGVLACSSIGLVTACAASPADDVTGSAFETPPASCRFTAMCVPGELDDGSDAQWYVHDLLFRTSDKIGAGPQSCSLAVWTAREANRVSLEGEGEEAVHEPA